MPETIAMVLEKIRKKETSYGKASKRSNISLSTLRRKLKLVNTKSDGGQPILTSGEKNNLVTT